MLFRLFLSSIAALSFFPSSAHARSCGYASHYGIGDGYHGQRAADGSRFNAHGLTVASPHLPFGTWLRVTNQRNGRSVIVKVTDRGPYYGDRVLDLSYGAFARIAHPDNGEVRVCYSRV
jgi:rare lipoprotein A